MVQKVRKAIFPVAGLGTRFLPATKAMPKEMLTLVDKPLIQYAVDEAREAGIEEFIFVTSRGKGALQDHFDAAPELTRKLEEKGKTKELALLQTTEMDSSALMYTLQREALGLGHAVWCARHMIQGEPFAVLLPDDVVLAEKSCLRQMMGAYENVGGNMVAVTNVPREKTASYGILDIEKDDGDLVSVRGLVEKPAPEKAPSTLSIIGRYIFQPQIMDVLDKAVKSKKSGAGGEIQLTDSMQELLATQKFHGFRYHGTRYDCGDKLGFIEATVAFALARPDLRKGVEAIIKTYKV